MIPTESPLDVLIAIAAFIVAIGILVSVHEFGHFWVARRLGVRVLRFSIGFGKPLWRRTSADRVEYVVAAIPLGGYVKLLDEREGVVPAHEAAQAFNRQPVWKRIAVLLAGPAFNLIFAVMLYWILFVAGVPALKPIVGEVEPQSIASRAGLRYEDQIIAVAGKQTETLEAATLGIIEDLTDDGTIHMRVRGVDGGERELALIAGDRSRALTQPEALLPGLGFDIWRPRVAAIVGTVVDGSAADKAGLQVGDEILKFEDQPIAAGDSPRGCDALAADHDRRGYGGRQIRRTHRGRAPEQTNRHRAHRAGLADAAEVRRGGGGRAGRSQDLGHLDLHPAHRRAHPHRRCVVESDFGSDQYRGNHRIRCASGLADLSEHARPDQHQPRRTQSAPHPDP
jgi:Peptidase family M50/PDZ domain